VLLAAGKIPVLILSNSSREDDRQQAMQLGAAGYCVKANLSRRELGVQVDQLVQRDYSN
jgi:DNA-binding NarL/FixJ family response regulator